MDRTYSIICTRRFAESPTHRHLQDCEGVIAVANLRVVKEIVATAAEEGRDIARVIFEESVDDHGFLRFLANLPSDFRGDVLMIRAGRGGFLSSIARGDGRVLYELGAGDLELYLQAHFASLALERPEPAAVGF